MTHLLAVSMVVTIQHNKDDPPVGSVHGSDEEGGPRVEAQSGQGPDQVGQVLGLAAPHMLFTGRPHLHQPLQGGREAQAGIGPQRVGQLLRHRIYGQILLRNQSQFS